MDRSERQHWGEGDVEYTPPQCSDCKNSNLLSDKDDNQCKKFGKKPLKYLFSEEPCPFKSIRA